MEDKIGSIEVGKYADLVVLEKNLFDVKPREISKVKVLATMMDGKFTYESKDKNERQGNLHIPEKQRAVANLMEILWHARPAEHAHQ